MYRMSNMHSSRGGPDQANGIGVAGATETREFAAASGDLRLNGMVVDEFGRGLPGPAQWVVYACILRPMALTRMVVEQSVQATWDKETRPGDFSAVPPRSWDVVAGEIHR